MDHTLPSDPQALLAASWETFEPCYLDLQKREVTPQTLSAWLADWSYLADHVQEL